MREDHLLLKLFVLSLLVHLGVLPFFSLMLPSSRRAAPRVEVTLRQLPPVTGKSLLLAKAEISPQLPRARSRETVLLTAERTILSRETKASFGSRAHAVLTATTPAAAPEFKVRFPTLSVTPFDSEEEVEREPGISEEIIGPGGQRKVLYRDRFSYPDWAQRKALEGNIRIKFWVEGSGIVGQTELLVSSGYPQLDILVEESFRKWMFDPVPGAQRVWGEIIFRLRLR